MPDKKRFLLRLEPDVFEAVQRWADDELRSVNGQIELLLRGALRDAGRLRRGPADAAASGGAVGGLPNVRRLSKSD
jgi:hypothetical protein